MPTERVLRTFMPGFKPSADPVTRQRTTQPSSLCTTFMCSASVPLPSQIASASKMSGVADSANRAVITGSFTSTMTPTFSTTSAGACLISGVCWVMIEILSLSVLRAALSRLLTVVNGSERNAATSNCEHPLR